MFRKCLTLAPLCAMLAIGFAAPLRAQSTDAATASAEELQALFTKQKTRGLALAPTSTVIPTTTVAGETTIGTPAAVEIPTDVAPVAYSQIDKADQVNVRISFDFDSSVLRADEKPKLATLCQAMKSVDVAVFRIVGHTDGSGSDAYNEKLSLLRAQEVKRFLISDCGLDAARLEAVGMGKRFLFNADNPRADENRRVEFQALS
ncbi:MAG: OmpA family protein [Paracoccaceae bacterium]|nr:OmpA family protein [Paracoccaceae bacterium]